MANLDLKALLQGIKPVPSVPSKSATNFRPSNQDPNDFTSANQNPTNFTTANQNPTESAGYQDYGMAIGNANVDKNICCEILPYFPK